MSDAVHEDDVLSSPHRPEQLLRLRTNQVRDDGEQCRDLGSTHHLPGSDAVAGRLESPRERLKQEFTFFEGLAFAHP